MKYYEIISHYLPNEVVGVCTSDGMKDVFNEENGTIILGQITKKQFEKFCDDNEWSEPISKKRFKGKMVFQLEQIQ